MTLSRPVTPDYKATQIDGSAPARAVIVKRADGPTAGTEMMFTIALANNWTIYRYGPEQWPAGRYQVGLITMGAPARATLSLAGLGCNRTVHPRTALVVTAASASVTPTAHTITLDHVPVPAGHADLVLAQLDQAATLDQATYSNVCVTTRPGPCETDPSTNSGSVGVSPAPGTSDQQDTIFWDGLDLPRGAAITAETVQAGLAQSLHLSVTVVQGLIAGTGGSAGAGTTNSARDMYYRAAGA